MVQAKDACHGDLHDGRSFGRHQLTKPLSRPAHQHARGDVTRPPLRLLQLRSVLESKFGTEVDVKVIYEPKAFAKHLRIPLYQTLCGASPLALRRCWLEERAFKC